MHRITATLLYVSTSATAQGGGALNDWIHLDIIRALVRHATAVIAAVALFAAAGYFIQRFMHEGPIKRAVRVMDELVLLALFAYLAYELFVSLGLVGP